MDRVFPILIGRRDEIVENALAEFTRDAIISNSGSIGCSISISMVLACFFSLLLLVVHLPAMYYHVVVAYYYYYYYYFIPRDVGGL